MSSSWDSIQRALETLEGDQQTQVRLRFAISALHDWDHAHGGILNRYVPFAREAAAAEQATMDAHRRGAEDSSPRPPVDPTE